MDNYVKNEISQNCLWTTSKSSVKKHTRRETA